MKVGYPWGALFLSMGCAAELGSELPEETTEQSEQPSLQSEQEPMEYEQTPGDTPGPHSQVGDGDAQPFDGTPACLVALFDFGGKCGGGPCHDNGPYSGAGLDLASPGVADRLINQPATHADVEESSGCPDSAVLIDTARPEESWILRKLDETQCGAKMPVGAVLTEEERNCLVSWVTSFADAPTAH